MSDRESIISIEKSIRYISAHVKSHGREILKKYELSPLQFVALQWVDDKVGITIGELSNRLDLAHSTTTDIVDKLENGGFVERQKYEKDKRIVLVLMKDKGLQIIKEVIAKRVSYISEITDHLSPKERDMLPGILESILHESEKRSDE
ncbi:MarR family transcriptional regulator [Salinicoccus sp. ID82-1]|uniref:MarR family transcriptional regulator n=1 Tax=Salinicoccus cyprini TaxID=2493691 RepID=A0A558AZG8_9STAP|nr:MULTISPECIES: MarR family transcriptional regulator [Salinicoccus]MCG1009274.1 MarR family transcriptional regulator [Salinicoccus sp. ID82-1]TVT29651.1 MarR family transcriptional regulator [Salinicoccus cyprini]